MPAESGAVARSTRHWPLLVVVGGVLAGLAIAIVAGQWQVGCVVMGCALGIGAIERLVLPRNEAGLLQVRSKLFDVIALLLAAAGVAGLAILVPNGR